jgi:hypothetical protein
MTAVALALSDGQTRPHHLSDRRCWLPTLLGSHDETQYGVEYCGCNYIRSADPGWAIVDGASVIRSLQEAEHGCADDDGRAMVQEP